MSNVGRRNVLPCSCLMGFEASRPRGVVRVVWVVRGREDAAVAAARGRATSSPESTSRTSESLIERWYACSVDGGIADMGFFVGDSLPVPVLVGLKREERDASGAARAGKPSASPPPR